MQKNGICAQTFVGVNLSAKAQRGAKRAVYFALLGIRGLMFCGKKHTPKCLYMTGGRGGIKSYLGNSNDVGYGKYVSLSLS